MEFQYTRECAAAIRLLRSHGCAVVIFNPVELRGTDPSLLEGILSSRGNDAIEELQGPAPDDDDSDFQSGEFDGTLDMNECAISKPYLFEK